MTYPRMLGSAFLAAVALLAWAAWSHRPVTAPVGTPAVPATTAQEVAAETTAPVPVQGGAVKAYRPAVKRRFGLPQAVEKDPGVAVVSASVVPANGHPQEVTAVLNTQTGEVTQYVRERSLPWLAADFSQEVGFYGGPAGQRIDARQDLIQVKALHAQGMITGLRDGRTGDLHGEVWLGVVYRR